MIAIFKVTGTMTQVVLSGVVDHVDVPVEIVTGNVKDIDLLRITRTAESQSDWYTGTESDGGAQDDLQKNGGLVVARGDIGVAPNPKTTFVATEVWTMVLYPIRMGHR